MSRIHMRGFASMTPERRRRIASLGGKSAHARGTAHEWTPAEASVAGKRGAHKRSENRVRQFVAEYLRAKRVGVSDLSAGDLRPATYLDGAQS